MTRAELWLRTWISLADPDRHAFCTALRTRCLDFVSKRPRLRIIGISAEEVFSEVIAKLLSASLSGETTESHDGFELMVTGLDQIGCPLQDENRALTWLLAELANTSSLRHRCIDILRRNSPKREVAIRAEGISVQMDRVDQGRPTAANDDFYEPDHDSPEDIQNVKLGLLCFARLKFQIGHDCFSLMKLAVRLGDGFAIGQPPGGPGMHVPPEAWPYAALLNMLSQECIGSPWTKQRVQAAQARLTLDDESSRLVALANGLPGLFQKLGSDNRMVKKGLAAAWNAERPDDVLTLKRLNKIVAKIKDVASYWDSLELLKLGPQEETGVMKPPPQTAAPEGAAQEAFEDPTRLWSGECLRRGRMRLQALASDWEVLEIVELLWRERELQDEISLHQTKAWPNRQIAAKLRAIHALPLWTADRVEQAVRKLRSSLEQYRKRCGLDLTDFKALLAKISRGYSLRFGHTGG